MKQRLQRDMPALFCASALGIVGAMTAFVAPSAAAEAPKASILGTPQQIAKEALALRLYASAPVQRELKALEDLYEKQPLAAMPGGRATLKAAAESMAMNAAHGAVNKDADRPVVLWGSNAAHKWHGLDVPRSGLVQDNPDNVYRSVPIDGAARYEIRGKVKSPGPTQETFVLYSVLPGSGKNGVKEHLEESGSVFLDKLPVARDGTFTITIDASPVQGRANHIQSQPDKHAGSLLIRDTLGDWAVQNPVHLEIRRISGPPMAPAPTEAQLADRAADLLATIGPYWMDWENKVFFSRPANTFSLNFARGTGWGFIKCGHYEIADDEALVVNVERRQAEYLGFQLADLWGPAVDYVNRNGSMTQAQARPNADGTYTYVTAVKDPGVYNWLDPSGLAAGTFCSRWQKLPAGVSAEDAVKSVKVVKLQDLKGALPPETVWVSPEQRKAQLTQRTAAYARRLSE
jgi:hypothetical protein